MNQRDFELKEKKKFVSIYQPLMKIPAKEQPTMNIYGIYIYIFPFGFT